MNTYCSVCNSFREKVNHDNANDNQAYSNDCRYIGCLFENKKPDGGDENDSQS